jgi:hypothetical protein
MAAAFPCNPNPVALSINLQGRLMAADVGVHRTLYEPVDLIDYIPSLIQQYCRGTTPLT